MRNSIEKKIGMRQVGSKCPFTHSTCMKNDCRLWFVDKDESCFLLQTDNLKEMMELERTSAGDVYIKKTNYPGEGPSWRAWMGNGFCGLRKLIDIGLDRLNQ
jgi:hypothetical protein